MSCFGECPLDDICAERIRVAEAVLAQCDQLVRESDSEINWDGLEGTDITHAQESAAISIRAASLSSQITQELTVQFRESFACEGVLLSRNGLLRRKGQPTCGSQARRERLQDSLVRRFPVELVIGESEI